MRETDEEYRNRIDTTYSNEEKMDLIIKMRRHIHDLRKGVSIRYQAPEHPILSYPMAGCCGCGRHN